MVFCSDPLHLSLRWAYYTPTAIGAPKAAPKWPDIPQSSCVLLCLPHDASMWPSHKNILMWNGFLFSPTSSKSGLGISHTHGHRGPHGGPKTIRDTPKVAAFCFVRLMMLAYDPPIRLSSCIKVFGQRSRQGTKSCRVGWNSVCPYVCSPGPSLQALRPLW